MPDLVFPQTISDALHTATTLLSRVSASPRLDAELLLEHVTGRARVDFRAAPERELPPAAGWSFQQLLSRRLRGEPIAYIRGVQEFWSLLFEVTPAVLIPRADTELLVVHALTHVAKATSVRIADLGTGSGAIALAIARERPQARLVATDRSSDALALASRNAHRLQIDNVEFVQGDWYAPLAGQCFDVVVANPPYIAQGDPDLAPEVRRFEPGLALFADADGLAALTVLVRQAPGYLLPCGWLLLEHSGRQAQAVRDLLVHSGFAHVRSHTDLAGHERVTEGLWERKEGDKG